MFTFVLYSVFEHSLIEEFISGKRKLKPPITLCLSAKSAADVMSKYFQTPCIVEFEIICPSNLFLDLTLPENKKNIKNNKETLQKVALIREVHGKNSIYTLCNTIIIKHCKVVM